MIMEIFLCGTSKAAESDWMDFAVRISQKYKSNARSVIPFSIKPRDINSVEELGARDSLHASDKV